MPAPLPAPLPASLPTLTGRVQPAPQGRGGMLGLPSSLPSKGATSSGAEVLASTGKPGHDPPQHCAESCRRPPGMQPPRDRALGVAGGFRCLLSGSSSCLSFPMGSAAQRPWQRGGKSSSRVLHCSVQAASELCTYALCSGTRLAAKESKRVKAGALPPGIFGGGCRVVQGGSRWSWLGFGPCLAWKCKYHLLTSLR